MLPCCRRWMITVRDETVTLSHVGPWYFPHISNRISNIKPQHRHLSFLCFCRRIQSIFHHHSLQQQPATQIILNKATAASTLLSDDEALRIISSENLSQQKLPFQDFQKKKVCCCGVVCFRQKVFVEILRTKSTDYHSNQQNASKIYNILTVCDHLHKLKSSLGMNVAHTPLHKSKISLLFATNPCWLHRCQILKSQAIRMLGMNLTNYGKNAGLALPFIEVNGRSAFS